MKDQAKAPEAGRLQQSVDSSNQSCIRLISPDQVIAAKLHSHKAAN